MAELRRTGGGAVQLSARGIALRFIGCACPCASGAHNLRRNQPVLRQLNCEARLYYRLLCFNYRVPNLSKAKPMLHMFLGPRSNPCVVHRRRVQHGRPAAPHQCVRPRAARGAASRGSGVPGTTLATLQRKRRGTAARRRCGRGIGRLPASARSLQPARYRLEHSGRTSAMAQVCQDVQVDRMSSVRDLLPGYARIDDGVERQGPELCRRQG